jgi:hypothetical protein
MKRLSSIIFPLAAAALLGLAVLAGRGWTILAVVLFLVMAMLAFVQRRVTGM